MRVDAAQIGLLTWHYYKNVGSNLQAYAIQTAIESLGYSCAFLNYRGEHKDNPFKALVRGSVSTVCKVIPKVVPEIYRAESYRFQETWFKMTKPIYGKENIKELIPNFDLFLCGSDQIWAPNVLNDAYLFSFLDESKPRCSYAASIGLNRIPNKLDPIYKKYLSRFNYITVREQQGCDLLKQKYGIRSECVLDPSFLVPSEKWKEISKGPMMKDKYIFCYFLGTNPEHREWVKKLSRLSKFRVICLTDDRSERVPEWECHYRIGPEKFLWYLSHSEFVLTDSFHGIALSINMQKPFYAVERFTNADEINQNSRIYNILRLLGLQDQLLSASPNELPSIDYKDVAALLTGEREKSISLLRKMIEQSLDVKSIHMEE